MPHFVANRARQHDFVSKLPGPRDHYRWESINALAYNIGGVVFVVGSVMFFPQLSDLANLGAWSFVLGSLIYLVVNLHDAAEVIRHRRSVVEGRDGARLEALAVLAYMPGTLLFVVGSLFFLSWIGMTAAGAWCFIAGSLLFLVGACVNVLQIVRQRSMAALQLLNVTAIAFIAGSLLFAVASIPYLWDFAPQDEDILRSFLAGQFVAGSVLFTLGGLFNWRRAYLVVREEAEARGGDGGAREEETA